MEKIMKTIKNPFRSLYRLSEKVWNHPVHWRMAIIKLIIGAIVLTGLVLLGKLWGQHIPEVERYISGLGLWGPVIFTILFIALMPFFVPNASFALIAGALFGLWWGTVIVVIAGLISELVLFSLGHKVLRARVDYTLKQYPKLLAIRKALIKKPIKLMILLRLSPIPFTPICYLLSTTRISYRKYILGYVGFIPGNFVTVYFGFVAKHVAKMAGKSDNISPPELAIAIIGLVACILLITYISHAAKQAIAEVQAEESGNTTTNNS
jgi:uncharacterized membrane protein YdjX (TVP38/TMEM64 family)